MTPDTFATKLRRLADRPVARWAAVCAGVVGVAGAAFVMLAPTAPEADARGGPVLQIALRAAPEPVHSPGDIMDVGALTDQLDREALARSEAAEREAERREQAYLAQASAQTYDDGYPPQPFPEYREQARVIMTPPPRPEHPVRREFAGRPQSFGFDTPRPDYEAEREARRAEREARMAQREARMAHREARLVRRYSSQGETSYVTIE